MDSKILRGILDMLVYNTTKGVSPNLSESLRRIETKAEDKILALIEVEVKRERLDAWKVANEQYQFDLTMEKQSWKKELAEKLPTVRITTSVDKERIKWFEDGRQDVIDQVNKALEDA